MENMETIFREAKQSRIFQDVVEQIEDAVINGKLKTGDRLPPERELKKLLNISRSTLREALRVLEQKGLITVRLGMGGGAVVKQVSSDQVSQSLGLLIRSQQVSLRQLAEFRERFEGDVAALAASRSNTSNLESLRALLREARRCVKGGSDRHEAFLEADKKIHLFFAQMTENPIYITICKTIHDNIFQYYERYLIMDTRKEENYSDLKDLVAAIGQGRSEDARALAQAHVRRFNQYMEEHQESEISMKQNGRGYN